MSTATIGSRFQVVIPAAERKTIGLKPDDKVSVDVSDNAIIIRPVDARHHRGLGKELADGCDAADYVWELRDEWGKRR